MNISAVSVVSLLCWDPWVERQRRVSLPPLPPVFHSAPLPPVHLWSLCLLSGSDAVSDWKGQITEANMQLGAQQLLNPPTRPERLSRVRLPVLEKQRLQSAPCREENCRAANIKSTNKTQPDRVYCCFRITAPSKLLNKLRFSHLYKDFSTDAAT